MRNVLYWTILSGWALALSSVLFAGPAGNALLLTGAADITVSALALAVIEVTRRFR